MTVDRRGNWLTVFLAILVAGLFALSLMTGPAHFSPQAVARALVSDDGVTSIIVRDIRLPRTLLAILIGATFGLAGASLQGLLRNPLAEPSLFGAPQAAAATAAAIMAFGFANALSLAVPLGGIAGALLSVGALVAIAGRRASLTVTLLAGLALGEPCRRRHSTRSSTSPPTRTSRWKSRSGCSARCEIAAWNTSGWRRPSCSRAGLCSRSMPGHSAR